MGLLPLPSQAENQKLFADALARQKRREMLIAAGASDSASKTESSENSLSKNNMPNQSVTSAKSSAADDSFASHLTSKNKDLFLVRGNSQVLQGIKKAFQSR